MNKILKNLVLILLLPVVAYSDASLESLLNEADELINEVNKPYIPKVTAKKFPDNCYIHTDHLSNPKYVHDGIVAFGETPDIDKNPFKYVAAQLLDSDYRLFVKPKNEYKPPKFDITASYNVPPLGNVRLNDSPLFMVANIDKSDQSGEPADEINSFDENYVLMNVFERPNNTISVISSNDITLHRFSLLKKAETIPYSILSIYFSDSISREEQISLVKEMRKGLYFTNRQLAEYGVQFAVRDSKMCTTLSYKTEKDGRVKSLYTDNYGNVDKSAQIIHSDYEESLIRNNWHKIPALSDSNITYEITNEIDTVGLLSTFDADMSIVFRDYFFSVVETKFEKIGDNNASFKATAKKCTNLAFGKYDGDEKKWEYSLLHPYITSCMKKSGFIKKDSTVVYPAQTIFLLKQDNIDSQEYYVRKAIKKSCDNPISNYNIYTRYQVSKFRKHAENCISTSKTLDLVATCLESHGYELMPSKKISPPMIVQSRNLNDDTAQFGLFNPVPVPKECVNIQ